MSDKKEKKIIKYDKYQQGDVVMYKLNDEDFKAYNNEDKGSQYPINNYTGQTNTKAVFAFGEVTGHTHRVEYQGDQPTNAILAFGEATGHKHQINMADMVKDAGVTLHMNRFQSAGVDVPKAFEVHNETVTIEHEEHNAIDIPPGKYVIRIVREFDHIAGRSRYVAD